MVSLRKRIFYQAWNYKPKKRNLHLVFNCPYNLFHFFVKTNGFYVVKTGVYNFFSGSIPLELRIIESYICYVNRSLSFLDLFEEEKIFQDKRSFIVV